MAKAKQKYVASPQSVGRSCCICIYIYNYSIVISTYIYITPKTERGSRDREKERRSDPGKIMSNLEQRLPTSGPII